MTRMPTLYIPHGGGPWGVMRDFFPTPEVDALHGWLAGLPGSVPMPKAILIVSAHWEATVPTVQSGARPPLLFDYYGFPPAMYELTWPAPGAPALAQRVRALLSNAGIDSAEDAERGFDHGVFVPLMAAWPTPTVPTAQLSLVAGLDPQTHLAIGRALAPLRDEGVLIIGSGLSFHNQRAFGNATGRDAAEQFAHWLRAAALAAPEERARALIAWASAPAARLAHPREEHLIPLHVVAGAASTDAGTLAFDGTFGGARICGFRYE